MSTVTLAEARARGITLPTDDAVAQDIIDEQESWLARRIGPLEGGRTETFYVGVGRTRDKLSLRRYTDSAVVTDGGATVSTDLYRLVDNGSAIVRTYAAGSRWWTGPYVTATYTPSDLVDVRRVIFQLLALAGETGTPDTGYESETIGDYSYSRGAGGNLAASKAALVSSLLPKRDPLVSLASVSRRVDLSTDPVINRPEPVW